MKFLESHFWYNKNQRNGILFLIALILILQIIYVFVDFSIDDTIINENKLTHFQVKIDSLKTLKKLQLKQKIYPFNPNYINDFKGYQLGMTVLEIDRLLAYRKTGEFVNSAAQFQKVTLVSDGLLSQISPYFKFPNWKKNWKPKSSKQNKVVNNTNGLNYPKKDLNSATEEDLQRINGIGIKLSKRIISYRDLLKGFSYVDQIYEVYYLDKEIANKVLSKFKIIQKPEIQKININTATFKEILHLPYIDYDLTKKIFDYKREVIEIIDLEELKKIEAFPIEKFDRIALYLQTESND